MEDIASEIGKGILRGLGHVLVEVLFNFVFYYIGWPICKILTLGTYPKKQTDNRPHSETRQGFLCSAVGLFFVIIIGLYLSGQFDIVRTA